MNYEQKYNEALERMKSWVRGEHPECFSEAQKAAEFIFPELQESYGDKIRKALIDLVKCNERSGYTLLNNISTSSMLAWLEKQGEQKDSVVDFKAKDWYVSKVDGKIHNIYYSVDKAEPKFKVGDWVVDDETPNDVFCVIEVLGEIYKVIDIDGGDYHIPHCKADKQFHLWTLQDAKDGDVLAFDDNTIVIFKDLYNATTFHSYCHIEDGLFNVSEDGAPHGWEGEGFYPATKEQRDLLFTKMKEAGYEWDSEKKELKKIEDKMLDADKVIEWLDEHVPTKFEDMQNYVNQFKRDFGL